MQLVTADEGAFGGEAGVVPVSDVMKVRAGEQLIVNSEWRAPAVRDSASLSYMLEDKLACDLAAGRTMQVLAE